MGLVFGGAWSDVWVEKEVLVLVVAGLAGSMEDVVVEDITSELASKSSTATGEEEPDS